MENILKDAGQPTDPGAATSPRIGERLVAAGLISEQQLRQALELQQSSGMGLGQVLMAEGWVRPLDFYSLLAEQYGLPFVNLVQQPPDPALFDAARLDDYARRHYVPWRRRGARLQIAIAEAGEDTFAALKAEYGAETEFVVTSRLDILWTVQRLAHDVLVANAIHGRERRDPVHSARTVLDRHQKAAAVILLVSLGAAMLWKGLAALVVLHALIIAALTGSFLLRAVLVWRGSSTLFQVRTTREELESLDPRSLPIYTILVPLYRDAAVVPTLANALRRLDYPRSRLDIRLILEGDDPETIEACKRAGLEANVELVVVPPSDPRTKPKALNYALPFAQGQFLTIYDAEDIPEPDQLKRAVAAFRKAPWDVVCFQARLNYFNWNENWLTRLFTLEYSLWFDWYLPGLESLGIPIPLGGTSNHFRVEVIRALGGWDPFNVTEDADLGLRFTMSGWKVGVLDSTTFEEANCRLRNWINQRSRWIKGYIQTWLVYMRRPWRTLRRLGWRGFIGFQAFIGGSFLAPLVFPPLAAMYLYWLLTRTTALEPLFPGLLLDVSLFLLPVANGLLIYFHMLAGWQRGRPTLVLWAIQLPAYYFLMSLAAWKAFWQLVRRPHYWEKTVHGLTQMHSDGREDLSRAS